MATCGHRCGKDLGEPVKVIGARKYYVCKACGHRISTEGFTWSSHGNEPFDFEGSDEFDFGFDASKFDFGF